MRNFIIFLLFIKATISVADQNRQALRALEKGDYADAEEHLQRSLADDVVNPGARYIYSLIYLDESFPRFDLDSAYLFVLQALEDFQISNEKTLKELEKNEIQLGDMERQKSKAEELAFLRADEKNTIDDYQFFMDHFVGAEQVPLALRKRNALLFESTEKENTWKAYQTFFTNYPEAEQVELARERYDELLYLDRTRDGKLSSLERFLKEHPHTPYRKETERKIFHIRNALNKPEDYLGFIRDYPDSYWLGELRSRFFHLDKDYFELNYLNQYTKNTVLRDSLLEVATQGNAYLIPFFENGKYGFIDGEGNTVLPSKYEYVKEDYLCGQIFSDLLEVREEGKLKLINYQGFPVYQEGFDVASDLTAGFVKMRKNGRFGLWHKGGYEILEAKYEDIQLLDHNLLKVKSNGYWGVFSPFGKQLLTARFDNIYLVEDYWIFEKDGLLAVANLDFLEPLKDGNPLSLDFKYDEVELVKEEYLLCYSGDLESLLNKDLDMVINSSDQTIIPMLENWMVKRDNGYSYYHEENGAFLEESFKDISFSKGWFAFRRDSTWTLLSEGFGFEPKFNQDSVRVLNDFMAYFQKGDTATLAFYPNRLVNLDFKEKIRLSGQPGRNDSSQYLIIAGKDIERVYSKQGVFQFNSRYDQVDYLSEGFFSYETRRRKGILDTNGKILVKAEYEGIGQVTDSLAPLLNQGAFGLYDLKNKVLIKPAYKKRIEQYANRLVALTSEGYGFLDRSGEELSEFRFQAIDYWNDSVAMVRENNVWALYNINQSTYELEGIRKIEYQKEKEEKIAYLLTEDGFGVYSNLRGEILTPSFNDIINLGTEDTPIYFAEKHVPEADFYVVVYANADGETIRSDAFREKEYDLIVCDQ